LVVGSISLNSNYSVHLADEGPDFETLVFYLSVLILIIKYGFIFLNYSELIVELAWIP